MKDKLIEVANSLQELAANYEERVAPPVTQVWMDDDVRRMLGHYARDFPSLIDEDADEEPGTLEDLEPFVLLDRIYNELSYYKAEYERVERERNRFRAELVAARNANAQAEQQPMADRIERARAAQNEFARLNADFGMIMPDLIFRNPEGN